MKIRNILRLRSRMAATGLLAATAVLSAGCSPNLASFDDVYVPQSVDENFPIKVVERSVKLTVPVTNGGLQAAEIGEISRFGRQARASATTPVTVSYPAGNKLARQVAGHAAGVLVKEGMARQAVLVTPYDGGGSNVTLTFARKVAETKPCGDWSSNMRGSQFNDSGPNFGCAFQQNFAAMIANPEDLQHPREMTPAWSAAQNPAMTKYLSGEWQAPIKDSTVSSNSSGSSN
ncbi:hypothetical protein DK847_02615 [Aestuariivirga litoralis]|uniref:Pilus assembly protein CpaD n=1 Tax=Aestuariivirga litoralis TaxID=2650924 RepID=A0A2W2ATX4_9HYPH|nr:CpaD family pilus assembly lipoprotein [Aestuariivirga litoralis]PZF78715.1 hypothetical protein DK847_02615 [Aestuariivirga litoralis]